MRKMNKNGMGNGNRWPESTHMPTGEGANNGKEHANGGEG
jgi:hypothetical protein